MVHGGMKGTGSTEYSLKDYFRCQKDCFEPFTEPRAGTDLQAAMSYFGMPLTA